MLKGSISNPQEFVKSYGVNDSAHGGSAPATGADRLECVTCGFVSRDPQETHICPNCRRWLVRPDRAQIARERRALFVPEFDSEPLTREERFHSDDLARELDPDQGWWM